MPVQIDAIISIAGTGAPTLSSGPLVKAITRMAAGQYRLQLQDNYSKLLEFEACAQSAPSGTPVSGGSFSIGTVYQIITMGTTTQAQWVTAGVPVGVTAAVGVVFKAAAAGAGTGTVNTIVSSGISSIELMGNNNNMLNNQPFTSTNGGFIDFQCMSPSFTAGAYTPAGTNSVPTFTGSLLATHTHAIVVAAGTAGDAVTNNAGVLNSTGGEDLITAATSGGTPAGTVSAPTFTGTAASLTGTISSAAADPTSGSKIILRVLLSNSSLQ